MSIIKNGLEERPDLTRVFVFAICIISIAILILNPNTNRGNSAPSYDHELPSYGPCQEITPPLDESELVCLARKQLERAGLEYGERVQISPLLDNVTGIIKITGDQLSLTFPLVNGINLDTWAYNQFNEIIPLGRIDCLHNTELIQIDNQSCNITVPLSDYLARWDHIPGKDSEHLRNALFHYITHPWSMTSTVGNLEYKEDLSKEELELLNSKEEQIKWINSKKEQYEWIKNATITKNADTIAISSGENGIGLTFNVEKREAMISGETEAKLITLEHDGNFYLFPHNSCIATIPNCRLKERLDIAQIKIGEIYPDCSAVLFVEEEECGGISGLSVVINPSNGNVYGIMEIRVFKPCKND